MHLFRYWFCDLELQFMHGCIVLLHGRKQTPIIVENYAVKKIVRSENNSFIYGFDLEGESYRLRWVTAQMPNKSSEPVMRKATLTITSCESNQELL